jgi:hypothetical protein
MMTDTRPWGSPSRRAPCRMSHWPVGVPTLARAGPLAWAEAATADRTGGSWPSSSSQWRPGSATRSGRGGPGPPARGRGPAARYWSAGRSLYGAARRPGWRPAAGRRPWLGDRSRAGRRPGPRSPWRQTIGADCPQAPGSSGDVCLWGQYTVAAIASTLGVSRASIYRHVSDAGS